MTVIFLFMIFMVGVSFEPKTTTEIYLLVALVLLSFIAGKNDPYSKQ